MHGSFHVHSPKSNRGNFFNHHCHNSKIPSRIRARQTRTDKPSGFH